MIGREILQIADAVAREKGIDCEEVIKAMEEAIQKIGRTKYGLENDIRAIIDRETGDVSLGLYREIVEEIEDAYTDPVGGRKKRRPSRRAWWFYCQ